MFCVGDPAQVPILHALELTKYCQNFFAIAHLFVRNVNSIFPVIFLPFAIGLLNRLRLFYLGVSVDAWFVVYSHNDVSFIVLASIRHFIAVIFFTVNQTDFYGDDGVRWVYRLGHYHVRWNMYRFS